MPPKSAAVPERSAKTIGLNLALIFLIVNTRAIQSLLDLQGVYKFWILLVRKIQPFLILQLHVPWRRPVDSLLLILNLAVEVNEH